MRLLLFQVRILERSQLKQLSPFNQLSDRCLYRGIQRLEQNGLLHVAQTVSVLPLLESAVINWCPGNEAPPLKTVCNQLRRRWRQWRPQRCVVFWASQYAVRCYGGVAGGTRQPLQLAHDLGTSAIFVQSTNDNPLRQKYWYGEDFMRQHPFAFPFMPDAALLNQKGVPQQLIEFGGQYSLRKLQRWHKACEAFRLPYELW